MKAGIKKSAEELLAKLTSYPFIENATSSSFMNALRQIVAMHCEKFRKKKARRMNHRFLYIVHT
jgi:hypothetical protein